MKSFAVTLSSCPSVSWIDWHCSERVISQKPQFKAWYPTTLQWKTVTAVSSSFYVIIMPMVGTNQMQTSLSSYISQTDLITNVSLPSASAFSSRITLTRLWVKATAGCVSASSAVPSQLWSQYLWLWVHTEEGTAHSLTDTSMTLPLKKFSEAIKHSAPCRIWSCICFKQDGFNQNTWWQLSKEFLLQ